VPPQDVSDRCRIPYTPGSPGRYPSQILLRPAAGLHVGTPPELEPSAQRACTLCGHTVRHCRSSRQSCSPPNLNLLQGTGRTVSHQVQHAAQVSMIVRQLATASRELVLGSKLRSAAGRLQVQSLGRLTAIRCTV